MVVFYVMTFFHFYNRLLQLAEELRCLMYLFGVLALHYFRMLQSVFFLRRHKYTSTKIFAKNSSLNTTMCLHTFFAFLESAN